MLISTTGKSRLMDDADDEEEEEEGKDDAFDDIGVPEVDDDDVDAEEKKQVETTSKKESQMPKEGEEDKDETEKTKMSAGERRAMQKEIEKQKQLDLQIAKWMKQQANMEKKRLQQFGNKVTVMDLKNTGVMNREDGDMWNRIEVSSGMNFDHIVQLLVSDAIDVPMVKHNHLYDPKDPKSQKKSKHKYVNVVLVQSGSQVVMLLPYTFPSHLPNSLNHWCFVNKASKQTKISLNESTKLQ